MPPAEALSYLAGGIAGVLIGWLITGFFYRQRSAGALDRANADLKALNAEFLDISRQHAACQGRIEHLAPLEEKCAALEADNAELRSRQARLATLIRQERKAAEEKVRLLTEARTAMTDAFKALAAGALQDNRQSFMDLARSAFSGYLDTAKSEFDARDREAKAVIRPLKEALDKYDQHVLDMERLRENAYGGLSEQLNGMATAQEALRRETGKLVKALRVPHVRGRWGEITLRRVAELAGMADHCDFYEQPDIQSDDGGARPDMVVRLPGGRTIVIDAKAPVSAYLDALEAETEDARKDLLAAHARQVQSHIHQLARKAYWEKLSETPEFVILFIPGENFFSAALTQDQGLIEEGAAKNVILATPTTLISLLKTAAFAWRQEQAAENARIISELGRELYGRLAVMTGHLNRLGSDIDKCAATYNQMVGSFERRVLASARKFTELGIMRDERKPALTAEPIEPHTRRTTHDETP